MTSMREGRSASTDAGGKDTFPIGRVRKLLRKGQAAEAQAFIRQQVFQRRLRPSEVEEILRITARLSPISEREVLFKLKSDLDGQALSDEDRHLLFPILKLGELLRDGPQRNLFVSGTARSGTTALGQLLNLSDDVAMLNERFAPFYGYHPLMFTDEHIVRGQRERALARFTESVAAIENRLGRAKFVGDKRPGFLRVWNISKLNYTPDQIKVLHIHRDIRKIAWSFKVKIEKAQAGRGRWSPSRDYMRAVAEYNWNNEALLGAVADRTWRANFVVVNYDDIFRSSALVRDVFGQVAIPVTDPLSRKIDGFIETSVTIVEKERHLSGEEEDYIAHHVNWKAANSVKGLC